MDISYLYIYRRIKVTLVGIVLITFLQLLAPMEVKIRVKMVLIAEDLAQIVVSIYYS